MARPKLGDSDTERLHVKITVDELNAIEDWRYGNRVPSRSEAVRRLCQMGLVYDQAVDEFETLLVEAFNDHNDRLSEVAEVLDANGYQSTEFMDAAVAAMIRTLDDLEQLSARFESMSHPARSFREAHTLDEALTQAPLIARNAAAELTKIVARQSAENSEDGDSE